MFYINSRNHLIQAGNINYQYDAENHRIAVNDMQYVINSQPNLSQALVRTKPNGETTYYGLGLIGEETNGEYLTYHYDFRGSTVALTDMDGGIVERFDYSPFGQLLTEPTHDTPFLFNGQYGVMTDANDLYYMRARFYSPDLRRFINQDILLGNIADGQSLNRFAYVTGNPVSFIDPFGLAEWDVYPNIHKEFRKEKSDIEVDTVDEMIELTLEELMDMSLAEPNYKDYIYGDGTLSCSAECDDGRIVFDKRKAQHKGFFEEDVDKALQEDYKKYEEQMSPELLCRQLSQYLDDYSVYAPICRIHASGIMEFTNIYHWDAEIGQFVNRSGTPLIQKCPGTEY